MDTHRGRGSTGSHLLSDHLTLSKLDPDAIPLRWRLTLGILKRLPQAAISRATGRLAECTVPAPFRGSAIRSFARLVGADLDEAAREPTAYRSISEFFTRELRDGVRSWPPDLDVPASPVDGVIGAHGTIRRGIALQAKGMEYSVSELLAEAGSADRFEGGRFLTIYLSPRHYHRIHAPVGGSVIRVRHVPGALLPVNEPAVRGLSSLFPRNERVIVEFDERRSGGRVALVAVGAFNVGRISSLFDPSLNVSPDRGISNLGDRSSLSTWEYDPPSKIDRGSQLLAFHLGSTVVLLFQADALDEMRGLHGLAVGHEVRLGEPIEGFGG